MASAVRQTIVARRKELKDSISLLTSQWQAAKDELAARRAELNGAEADLAELDAWLAANPAVAQPA